MKYTIAAFLLLFAYLVSSNSVIFSQFSAVNSYFPVISK